MKKIPVQYMSILVATGFSHAGEWVDLLKSEGMEELTGPTRSAAFKDEKALGPLMLQGDHGPVAYRNLRIKPL